MENSAPTPSTMAGDVDTNMYTSKRERLDKLLNAEKIKYRPSGGHHRPRIKHYTEHILKPFSLSTPDVSTFIASTSSTFKQYRFPKTPRHTPWPTIAGLESFLKRLLVRNAKRAVR